MIEIIYSCFNGKTNQISPPTGPWAHPEAALRCLPPLLRAFFMAISPLSARALTSHCLWGIDFTRNFYKLWQSTSMEYVPQNLCGTKNLWLTSHHWLWVIFSSVHLFFQNVKRRTSNSSQRKRKHERKHIWLLYSYTVLVWLCRVSKLRLVFLSWCLARAPVCVGAGGHDGWGSPHTTWHRDTHHHHNTKHHSHCFVFSHNSFNGQKNILFSLTILSNSFNAIMIR